MTSSPAHRAPRSPGFRLRIVGPVAVAVAAVIVAAPMAFGAAAPAAPATTTPTPCVATADACVSLSQDKAWLVRDGKVLVGPVQTSHGTDAEPTPTGTFTVQWKDADHYSSEGAGGPMPWSVFFDTHGRAFHGGSLTRNSVGCVHLSEQDAKTFYDALQPSDVVQILP